MPLTITNVTDGTDMISAQIQLPDIGSSVLVQGYIQKGALPQVSITGSPLTAPSPPGSGSIFWNIQVEGTTGAASVQQSTVSDPLPVTATSLVIFRQTLVPTSTDLGETPASTPDLV